MQDQPKPKHRPDSHLTLGIFADSAIPGSAPQMLHLRALPEFPCECMLASAAADDQYFHSSLSVQHDKASPPSMSTFAFVSFHGIMLPNLMHWDYILILLVLAILIPWRSNARIRVLLEGPELTSFDRI